MHACFPFVYVSVHQARPFDLYSVSPSVSRRFTPIDNDSKGFRLFVSDVSFGLSDTFEDEKARAIDLFIM